MTADSLVDPESAAKVGTVVAVSTGEVYRRDWQRWAAAVGDHNPLWFDPDYARKHGYRDIVCPPLYLQYSILVVAALGDLRPTGPGRGDRNMAFPQRRGGWQAAKAPVPPARLPRRRGRDDAPSSRSSKRKAVRPIRAGDLARRVPQSA
jgi:hypothetical protein